MYLVLGDKQGDRLKWPLICEACCNKQTHCKLFKRHFGNMQAHYMHIISKKLAHWMNHNQKYHDLNPDCSQAAWDSASILECMLSNCNSSSVKTTLVFFTMYSIVLA